MTLPVAQPVYILRGHASQIHATTFIRSNSRLVTGDGEGWIVSWSLITKRAVAVWRAHEGSILGVREWGDGRLITHGKDNKLIVWKYSEREEPSLSTILPIDTSPTPRPQPWILHILNVNTMNFCSFAQCTPPPSLSPQEEPQEELLIAVPNTMSSETVDIFRLPTSTRIHTIPNPPHLKGGMIMALSLFFHTTTDSLTTISAFESGHTTISVLSESKASNSNAVKIWNTIYISKPHSQPILSLCIAPDKSYYLTSSADAIIAKHEIPPSFPSSSSTSFSTGTKSTSHIQESNPLRTIQTKHAGQQGITIRNDGKIFATAGWDGRVRVYSTVRKMRELAVLKWHRVGCYAVGFADVGFESGKGDEEIGTVGEGEGEIKGSGNGKEIVRSGGGGGGGGNMLSTVKGERIEMATSAHWLVAGGKDGKVSLWDIY